MTATFPQPYCSNYPRVKITYIGATPENNTNTSSFSWSSINIPSAGLYAFVVQGTGDTFGSRSLSSLTIGGAGANIVSATNPTSISCNAIAYLRVASAGSVTIAAGFSGAMGQAVVHIFKITGNRRDAPYFANNANASSGSALSIALTIPRGGAAIFGAEIYTNTSNSSFTWSGAQGIVEAYDIASSVEKWTRSGAILPSNSGALSRTITATSAVSTSGPGIGLSGASWI